MPHIRRIRHVQFFAPDVEPDNAIRLEEWEDEDPTPFVDALRSTMKPYDFAVWLIERGPNEERTVAWHVTTFECDCCVMVLGCAVCDYELFEADSDGLFQEDTFATCQECGTICWISIDGEDAYVATAETVEDKGQPKCDGGCDAIGEFIGAPCRWDCTERKS